MANISRGVQIVKLTIFSYRDLMKPGGSMIRIVGYTYHLKDYGLKIDFFSLPFSFSRKLRDRVNFKKIQLPFYINKMIDFYSISPKLLSFLKYIIRRHPFIKRVKRINNPIIFHQNFKLGFYLLLAEKKICIYDIHGIVDLQRSRFKDRINGIIDLVREGNYFKYGKYFIVTSPEMKYYLKKKYNHKLKNIFVAKEGLLKQFRDNIDEDLKRLILRRYNLSKKDKIILFIGSFKEYGGVWDLTQAYYKIKDDIPNCKLILIGSGSSEQKIKKFINKNKLRKEIIIIGKSIEYNDLTTFQSIADLIICPDTNNLYNQLTPHIKVYDSLASGKPLILSDFNCLTSLIKNFYGIETFKPGNIEDLANKIKIVFSNFPKYSKEALKNKKIIEAYTYEVRSENFIQQISKRFKLG